MDNLGKSKYKKIILFSVAVILIIGFGVFVFYEYKQNTIENKKNVGIDLFKSGEYDKSMEQLNEYLESVPDDKDVKEIVSIISIYNTSKDYFDTGDFELVIATLETMPYKADEYPIKSKIDELKKNTSEAIKKKEIEAALVMLNDLIAKQDYDSAKDIIEKIEAMELSDEENLAELDKNKKIVEDYFIEKARLEKEAEEDKLKKEKEESKVAELKPDNNSQSGNNATVKQPYIAYTSPAAGSSQLITITSTGGSNGELVMWQKDNNGIWYEYDRMYARLGSAGMKAASEVYEKDMSTPTGVYTLTEAFGAAANPGSGVPYRQLDGSEYWVDDPNSIYYNTMQFGEANGRWTSAEHLIEYKNAYKYSLVIDYNRSPVIPGKSSAIFLHVDVGIPTWGCPAVAENKMIKILNWINPSSNPKVILGFTENYISNF